jgi:predicted unusual protein kinase regulating ubiquinone biosynthesis (AarF/ABC1/UbiB family)
VAGEPHAKRSSVRRSHLPSGHLPSFELRRLRQFAKRPDRGLCRVTYAKLKDMATSEDVNSYMSVMKIDHRTEVPANGNGSNAPGSKSSTRLQISSGPHDPATAESAELTHIGIKGYLRLLRIMASFFSFSARVVFNNRKSFRRAGVSDSELRYREGAALREKLLALGPTFIKIGQTLATRADLLPVEYIKELAKLQDEVPPFPTSQAMEILRQELQAEIAEIFDSFDDEPVASASLGQVYKARLQTGQVVAIKVQRPAIAEQISFDIKVLRRIARGLARYPNLIRGVDWQGALGEFRRTVFEEMDYEQEALNAEVFRANFADWKEVYVPRIYHVFSTKRLIVMEFVDGLKVTDSERLTQAGQDPHQIVRLLARTYLKQLLEDGFFHADPHPGNLRVMNDGRLAFFDFGMVGRLPIELQSKLINAFFHVVERDVHGLVEDMVRLGFIALSSDEESRFKPVIEGLFDRYLSKRLGDVNFKELIFDLAHVIYEFPFRIPASFTYIVRAVMTLEGIGTQVDPSFNFFEVARPYAKRFMFRREGRYLRSQLVNQFIRGEQGEIEWGKVWKLAKMAFKYYVRGENKM